MNLSRRNFLTGALLAAGATAAGTMVGCAGQSEPAPAAEETVAEPQATSGEPAWKTAPDPIPEDEIVETTDCEILIIGAGVAGLPAAMYAAEQGADVHVIEKGGSFGVARLCTAGFNSKCQLAIGQQDDRRSS